MKPLLAGCPNCEWYFSLLQKNSHNTARYDKQGSVILQDMQVSVEEFKKILSSI